ncbi:zf-HC2 domain-containing protein [Micromonospora echinospora]|uniref:zf-HC2 domain-containing protein n=1 Tax=Micromonospora echinospora TaxID=1877 RepID=UPI003A87DF9E
MRSGGESPTTEQATLALYLLGALDDDERETFEAHLAGCSRCLAEAGEVGGLTSGLAGLGPDDWAALIAAEPSLTGAGELPPPGVPELPPVVPADPPAPPAAGSPSPADLSAPPAAGPPPADPPAPPAAGPPSTGTVEPLPPAGVPPVASGSVGPAGARPGRSTGAGARPGGLRPDGARPGGTRPPSTGSDRSRPGAGRRRRLMIWSGAVAAVLAVVLAGGVLTGLVPGGRDDLVLTGTGEAPGQGVNLSVTITTDDDRGSTIRITATGLRPGLRYRLFAVTRDGRTHVVRDWLASSGPQEVTGELSLPTEELAFVTVGLGDGTALVTAPISRSGDAPR